MGYKIIGVDDSAIRTLGYAHKGAACPTFLVHELADLAAERGVGGVADLEAVDPWRSLRDRRH